MLRFFFRDDSWRGVIRFYFLRGAAILAFLFFSPFLLHLCALHALPCAHKFLIDCLISQSVVFVRFLLPLDGTVTPYFRIISFST